MPRGDNILFSGYQTELRALKIVLLQEHTLSTVRKMATKVETWKKGINRKTAETIQKCTFELGQNEKRK